MDGCWVPVECRRWAVGAVGGGRGGRWMPRSGLAQSTACDALPPCLMNDEPVFFSLSSYATLLQSQ